MRWPGASFTIPTKSRRVQSAAKTNAPLATCLLRLCTICVTSPLMTTGSNRVSRFWRGHDRAKRTAHESLVRCGSSSRDCTSGGKSTVHCWLLDCAEVGIGSDPRSAPSRSSRITGYPGVNLCAGSLPVSTFQLSCRCTADCTFLAVSCIGWASLSEAPE